MAKQRELSGREIFHLVFLVAVVAACGGGWLWDKYFDKKPVRPRGMIIPAKTPAASVTPPPSVATVPPVAEAPASAHEPVDFTPFAARGNELFPSHLLSLNSNPSSGYSTEPGLAPQYGINGSIGVVVNNVRKGETYVVSVSADRFINESTETFKIVDDSKLVVIFPRLAYDYVALRRNTQTSLMNLSFTVRRGGQSAGRTMTEKWQVHQINDCPFTVETQTMMKHGLVSTKLVSMRGALAGYVNENHPWIDTLLREAKETGICNEFVGYQGGREMIWPQVAAIWAALQNRGLSYSSITTTTTSERFSFQHVRFLDQSISSSQANCVDGSVLLCSILRKIGLNVGIMLVPGHAYVCVRDQENKQFIAGIETTMLGTSDLRTAVKMANSGGDYPLSKWNADYIYIDITESRKSRRNPIPFDEIAAIPSSRPYAGSHANSPAEIAREQRIILANKLSQRVTDLMSHRGSRAEEGFRIAAHKVFTEIRQCQSAFNRLGIPPSLERSGIEEADLKLHQRYGAIINLLKSKHIEISNDVNEADLTVAKELSDALVSLASLPLNY
jgi:hypothetical protein